jgi:hypothetical protein
MGMNLNKGLLVERGIFTKEELLHMVKVVDREMKKKTSGIKEVEVENG